MGPPPRPLPSPPPNDGSPAYHPIRAKHDSKIPKIPRFSLSGSCQPRRPSVNGISSPELRPGLLSAPYPPVPPTVLSLSSLSLSPSPSAQKRRGKGNKLRPGTSESTNGQITASDQGKQDWPLETGLEGGRVCVLAHVRVYACPFLLASHASSSLACRRMGLAE